MTQLLLDNEKQKIKLNEINEIQMNLLECIDSQNETLERIENNITYIDTNFQKSIDHLESANKNNIFYTPIIIGGIVGTFMVSPMIGILGMKTGTLFSLTGGLIGSFSGYKIQEF